MAYEHLKIGKETTKTSVVDGVSTTHVAFYVEYADPKTVIMKASKLDEATLSKLRNSEGSTVMLEAMEGFNQGSGLWLSPKEGGQIIYMKPPSNKLSNGLDKK